MAKHVWKKPKLNADPSAVRRTPAEEKIIQKKYGISENDYQNLLVKQNGVCAICQRHQRKQRLSIDHSHKTGRVRGLLCTRCNRNIGRFFDSYEMLQRAADYLKQSAQSAEIAQGQSCCFVSSGSWVQILLSAPSASKSVWPDSLFWRQEDAGSNPASPTIFARQLSRQSICLLSRQSQVRSLLLQPFGAIDQQARRALCKRNDVGSSPTSSTNFVKQQSFNFEASDISPLVQSPHS